MIELLKFVKDAFSSYTKRLKNPFLSVYFGALILLNWRILGYLMFSSDTVNSKLQNATSLYGIDSYFNIFIPILVALLYNGLPSFFLWTTDSFSTYFYLKRKDSQIKRAEKDLGMKNLEAWIKERDNYKDAIKKETNKSKQLQTSEKRFADLSDLTLKALYESLNRNAKITFEIIYGMNSTHSLIENILSRQKALPTDTMLNNIEALIRIGILKRFTRTMENNMIGVSYTEVGKAMYEISRISPEYNEQ